MDPEQAQPLMNVSADIRRWDLVVFNLYMLPRMKGNWIVFAIGAFVVFLFLVFLGNDQLSIPYLIFAIVSALIATAVGITTLFLFCLSIALFNATDKSGQLGPHVFTLREDGFHELTSCDESFKQWRGIYSVVAWKNGLYIYISWYLCHVIPARAFASRADFDRFSRLALELWTAAAKSS